MATTVRRRANAKPAAAGATIKYRCAFSNTIRTVLQNRGWKEGEHDGDWDLYWGDREWVYEIFDTMHLESTQRLNHFRNSKELCRKDLLVKNLKKKKRQLEKDGQYKEATQYDFFPVSFTLPREYAMFVEEFKRVGGIWIMKPIGSAQGKGIFLFTRLSEISEWKYDFRAKANTTTSASTAGGGAGGGKGDDAVATKDVEQYIVQRYISNPYLIGGKKFDLRLYVMVSQFMPLSAYLFQDGFARFTQTRYSSEPRDVANMFMHLTNVAIQKKSEDYDDRTGGKMDLRSLKLYMASKFGTAKVDAVFFEIEMIIIRSLQSVQQVMIQDKHCFEIFGYDIMIDDELKPWLIEVNASPSLTANTKSDHDLKTRMLNDALDIVDLEEKLLDGDDMVVGSFCKIISQGVITQHKLCAPPYTTILGTRHAGTHMNSMSAGDDARETASSSSAATLSATSRRETGARPGTTGRRARVPAFRA